MWGLGSAVLEETLIDPRSGAYVNANLADYLVPVAADTGFVEAIVMVAKQFDPVFDAATVETRPSKGGNYLGITITVTATSRPQLDELYRTLTAHPMVKIVL